MYQKVVCDPERLLEAENKEEQAQACPSRPVVKVFLRTAKDHKIKDPKIIKIKKECKDRTGLSWLSQHHVAQHLPLPADLLTQFRVIY